MLTASSTTILHTQKNARTPFHTRNYAVSAASVLKMMTSKSKRMKWPLFSTTTTIQKKSPTTPLPKSNIFPNVTPWLNLINQLQTTVSHSHLPIILSIIELKRSSTTISPSYNKTPPLKISSLILPSLPIAETKIWRTLLLELTSPLHRTPVLNPVAITFAKPAPTSTQKPPLPTMDESSASNPALPVHHLV